MNICSYDHYIRFLRKCQYLFPLPWKSDKNKVFAEFSYLFIRVPFQFLLFLLQCLFFCNPYGSNNSKKEKTARNLTAFPLHFYEIVSAHTTPAKLLRSHFWSVFPRNDKNPPAPDYPYILPDTAHTTSRRTTRPHCPGT